MPSANPRPEEPADNWKLRYLQGLDELEQKERHWLEVRKLLHKAVARLAAVAAEAHPALEPHLDRLRAAAREGGEGQTLAGIAGDLTDAALRLGPAERGASGAEVLVQLLERLDLPPEDGAAVSTLRERLARPVAPGDLPGLLDSVAGLVGKMRRGLEDERHALESFLQDVSEKLTELGTNLAVSDLSRRESLRDTRTLQEQVDDEVAVIRVSLDQASDLEGLKHAVRRGLTAVESRITKHLQHEEQRQVEVEKQSKAMTERLQRLETETGRLRERVRQARAEAVRDSLTGLHNRLAYEERIRQAFVHWKRYRDPLALMILDVDRFKALNDGFGHLAGDKALKALAERVRATLREADFVARYGGEEFVVLMPRTDLASAGTVAEKLRATVEQCPFQYRDHPVSVTVSCGYTEFREGDTPEAAFERADQAVYRAKQAGRNRCEAG